MSFLGDEIPDLPLEARQRLDISPETFGLTAGMKPHPEELVLKMCDSELVRPFDAEDSTTFVPGSTSYPSYQARDHAYRFDPDKRLAEHYVKQALPVIETQLARAGVRLAALLNAAFSTQPQPAPHPY